MLHQKQKPQILSLRTIALGVVPGCVRHLVWETARVSARAVAQGIAHLPARKNAPVRAGRRVRVDVQADAQTGAVVRFVEEIAPQGVKTNVYLLARRPVAEDVPTNVQVLAQVDAITVVREPARETARGLAQHSACQDVLEGAAIRAESAAPEQLLCFREPV